MTETLQIAVNWSGLDADVRLSGVADLTTSSLLRNTLLDVIDSAPGRVMVDLSGVSFVDVSGAGVLVGASRRASRRHCTLAFTKADAPAEMTLRACGLWRVLPVQADPPATEHGRSIRMRHRRRSSMASGSAAQRSGRAVARL